MFRNTKFYSLLASSTIGLSIACLSSVSHAAEAAKEPEITVSAPKSLPSFTYINGEGKEKTLEPTGHKLTILHLWATWCVPCVSEMKEVDDMARRFKDKSLQIIPLSEDGITNLGKVKEFYAKQHIYTLTVNIDKDMQALQAIKGGGLPLTLFIDEKGNEIARSFGTIDWKGKEANDFLASHLK